MDGKWMNTLGICMCKELLIISYRERIGKGCYSSHCARGGSGVNEVVLVCVEWEWVCDYWLAAIVKQFPAIFHVHSPVSMPSMPTWKQIWCGMQLLVSRIYNIIYLRFSPHKMRWVEEKSCVKEECACSVRKSGARPLMASMICAFLGLRAY